MKIRSWNVRGLNIPSKQPILKNYINKYKPYLILIQEIKLGLPKIEKFSHKLGFKKIVGAPIEGASGSLAIFQNPKNYQVEPLRIEKNWIGIKVFDQSNSLTFNLINVYGPTVNYDKKEI